MPLPALLPQRYRERQREWWEELPKIHMRMKVNFISFGTQNCEFLLEKFHANLLKTCKEDFILNYYAVGYESEVKGDRLKTRSIHPEIHQENPLFHKPVVLMKSLIDLDVDNFIYLDLDIQLTKKFSAQILFDSANQSKTPLSPNHFWENPFSFNGEDRIERGERICRMKSIERCNKYVQACLISYTRNHFQFLLFWAGMAVDEKSIAVSADDEELYNATLWKWGQTKTLGYICVTNGTVDVDGLGRFDSIERAYEMFESDRFNKSIFTDENNFYRGFDPENVMIFHGIK
jgi:hypothetical protein